MVSVRIILDGDGALPELRGVPTHHVREGIIVVGLEGGMQSGLPSIGIYAPLEDGSYVFAEMSMRMFITVANAFKAKYGDPSAGS